MKLGPNRVRHQLVTPLVPWLAHDGEGFGPPLLAAWLHPMRAGRGDHQGHQRHTSAGCTEPAQRVQKADTGCVYRLESGRWQDDQAHQVIDHREDGQFFPHTGDRLAVPDGPGHRRLEWAQRCFPLPAGAVPRGQGIGTVERRVAQGRHPRDRLRSKPRRADLIPDLAHPQGHWSCRDGRVSKPGWTGRGLAPCPPLVVVAQGGAPPGPRQAFARWRPPGARPDPGPTRGAIDHLSRPDTPHGRPGGLDEEGQMGLRTQPPVRHEHITGCEAGVHRLPVGESMRA